MLDTGAGYLALDHDLARRLGLMDEGDRERVGLTARPLQRINVGGLERDQVAPILTVDARIVREVADRPVLGLLGQQLFADRVVWLDYDAGILALIPAGADDPDSAHAEHASRALLATTLSSRAVDIPFELRGDGKIIVHARVSDPDSRHLSKPLTMIVDTGASKTVLFEHAIAASVRSTSTWTGLRGLKAPTLMGAVDTRMVRVPLMRLEGAIDGPAAGAGASGTGAATSIGGNPASGTATSGRLPGSVAEVRDGDVAVLDSDLEQALSQVVDTPVHGLLGGSFLKHFRVAIDYPHRMLWLDPIPHYVEDRPYEYSQVGIQLERREGRVIVVGVVIDSPAMVADLRVGDELVAIDGRPVMEDDLLSVSESLEGAPGTSVELELRRQNRAWRTRLIRKRLL